jgi:hypothetical protein
VLTKTRTCTVSWRVRIWPSRTWISARRLPLSSSHVLTVSTSYIIQINQVSNTKRKQQPSDKPVCCVDGAPGYLDPAVNTNTPIQISYHPVSGSETVGNTHRDGTGYGTSVIRCLMVGFSAPSSARVGAPSPTASRS